MSNKHVNEYIMDSEKNYAVECEEEQFLNEIYEFANVTKEPPRERRKECGKCRRPVTVCWCSSLPEERIHIKTSVYILQHPFEELRKLKTAPMLYQSLEQGKCHIIRGKKFGAKKRFIKYPCLEETLKHPNSLLLFPGDDAVNITELPPLSDGGAYNLVVLDGTWTQARGMYANNQLLKLPRKVMVRSNVKSRYVIRTQPTDESLSTLESVAVALASLENKPQLVDLLTAPLEALCKFQLDYGAMKHQSKEYKINHGLWTKTLPRRLLRRMEREKIQTTITDDNSCLAERKCSLSENDHEMLDGTKHSKSLEQDNIEPLCNHINQLASSNCPHEYHGGVAIATNVTKSTGDLYGDSSDTHSSAETEMNGSTKNDNNVVKHLLV